MQHESLDATIRDYINNCINEIKKDYEQEIQKLKTDEPFAKLQII